MIKQLEKHVKIEKMYRTTKNLTEKRQGKIARKDIQNNNGHIATDKEEENDKVRKGIY